MARTSKTKIGGEGESNDRMMRAAESGAAMKQRAHEGLMAQERAGQQQAMQQASVYGGLAEAGARRQEDARQFDESQALREDALNLEAAKSGFEREGAGGGDRAAQLDAEMDRGEKQGVGSLDPDAQKRLKDQTGQGVEYDGSRWVPSQARKDQQAFENERQTYREETDRIRAEAYRAQTAAQFNAAKLKGEEEEAKKLRGNLLQPIKSNVNRFERLQNGKQSSEDWASIAKMAKGFEDPSLQADIQAKQWSPRVQQFLNATIAYDSLKFIGQTGELPDGDMVDLSSPKMQEFTAATGQVASYMKAMGPEFSQWLGIDSMAAKTSFVNKMAASMVLSGMTAPGSYQPQGAFEGMTPSAGQPPEAGAAPPQQPQGDPYADVRQGARPEDRNEGLAEGFVRGPGGNIVQDPRRTMSSDMRAREAGRGRARGIGF